MKKEWFQSWFDSPYYHILYKNRDEKEAEFFLDNLLTELKLTSGNAILDIACGKGRHALYLNKKGFNVTGTDLSSESIRHCKKFETTGLQFFKHDMREIFKTNYYDAAFNLFTSFGYFDNRTEHLKAVESAALALKPGGIFVLDYFNSEKVVCDLPCSFAAKAKGIVFTIEKKIKDNFIEKEIRFTDKGNDFLFTEKVTLFTHADFEQFFKEAGLNIKKTFGSYKLEEFSPANSDRIIFVAEKI